MVILLNHSPPLVYSILISESELSDHIQDLATCIDREERNSASYAGLEFPSSSSMHRASATTGHNLYVMTSCAPSRLVLTHQGPLSVTPRAGGKVRRILFLWRMIINMNRFSGLGDQIKAQTNYPDLLSLADAVVKHVLERLNRGINWGNFHPTMRG